MCRFTCADIQCVCVCVCDYSQEVDGVVLSIMIKVTISIIRGMSYSYTKSLNKHSALICIKDRLL